MGEYTKTPESSLDATWIPAHSSACFSEPVLRQDDDTPVLPQILRPGLQSTQEAAMP